MRLFTFAFLSVVISVPAFAYKRVSFDFGKEASPVIVTLLAESEGLPEVDNPSFDLGIPIESAQCTATVLRPERLPEGGTEPSLADKDNKVECDYVQEGEGGDVRTITLSLAQVPIDFFGNNLHKRSFSFKGELATRLRAVMAKAHAYTSHSPLLTLDDDSFTTGDRHVTYAVRWEAPKPGHYGTLENGSPLLECMAFSFQGTLNSELCAFVYFGRE